MTTYAYDARMGGSRAFARQYCDVWLAMSDGGWHTLQEVAEQVDAPPQSVSARLRDMRKAKNGGHRVERRPLLGTRTFIYRLRPSQGSPQLRLFDS